MKYAGLGWTPPVPSHEHFMEVVSEALAAAMQRGMAYGDAQQIRWTCEGLRKVAWSSDYYAGASCPLRAAGYERDGLNRWTIAGARVFESQFDRAMNRAVTPGPGMIGLMRASVSQQTQEER